MSFINHNSRNLIIPISHNLCFCQVCFFGAFIYFDFFSVNYKRIVFIRAKFTHTSHFSFALNSVSGNGMPKKCIFAYFLTVGTLIPAIFAAFDCHHLPYAFSVNASWNSLAFRVLSPFALFSPPLFAFRFVFFILPFLCAFYTSYFHSRFLLALF